MSSLTEVKVGEGFMLHHSDELECDTCSARAVRKVCVKHINNDDIAVPVYDYYCKQCLPIPD